MRLPGLAPSFPSLASDTLDLVGLFPQQTLGRFQQRRVLRLDVDLTQRADFSAMPIARREPWQNQVQGDRFQRQHIRLLVNRPNKRASTPDQMKAEHVGFAIAILEYITAA